MSNRTTCRFCGNLGVAFHTIPVCMMDKLPVKLEMTCGNWRPYDSNSAQQNIQKQTNETCQRCNGRGWVDGASPIDQFVCDCRAKAGEDTSENGVRTK